MVCAKRGKEEKGPCYQTLGFCVGLLPHHKAHHKRTTRKGRLDDVALRKFRARRFQPVLTGFG